MLSKTKSKKQRARLAARQDAWEKMPQSDKFSAKSGRPFFTKPGSNKK